jgi:hypothetical protein
VAVTMCNKSEISHPLIYSAQEVAYHTTNDLYIMHVMPCRVHYGMWMGDGLVSWLTD